MDGGNMDGGMDHGHDHGHQAHSNHGSHGHNSLAQFLGIDNDHDHGDHGHDHGHDHGEAPQQTAIWNSALKGLSLKSFFSGFVITPNMLLLMLFTGFALWLPLVYWIRHNEPFANAVLGTHRNYAPTAHEDQKILAGTRGAMPFMTNENSGKIYTPQTAPPPQPQMQHASPYMAGPAHSTAGHRSMRSYSARDSRANMLAAAAAGQPMAQAGAQNATQNSTQSGAPAPAPVQNYGWSLAESGLNSQPTGFMTQFGQPMNVTVESSNGSRLRVITDR